jgi:hypothetical protein
VPRRLGSTSGATEIKSHAFFKDVNWKDVAGKKTRPPFVPFLTRPDDVSNFDVRFTAKAISRESDERASDGDDSNGNLDSDDDASCLFPGFDFVSPDMLSHQLDDKVLNLQDLRIRGFGNP